MIGFLDASHLIQNRLFRRLSWVSQYQKGKIRLDLNEARDDWVFGCSGISLTVSELSKVLRPTRYKIGYFGDVFPSQFLGSVLNSYVNNLHLAADR